MTCMYRSLYDEPIPPLRLPTFRCAESMFVETPAQRRIRILAFVFSVLTMGGTAGYIITNIVLVA